MNTEPDERGAPKTLMTSFPPGPELQNAHTKPKKKDAKHKTGSHSNQHSEDKSFYTHKAGVPNIFSNLKLVYIFSVNPYLGPLQVHQNCILKLS